MRLARSLRNQRLSKTLHRHRAVMYVEQTFATRALAAIVGTAVVLALCVACAGSPASRPTRDTNMITRDQVIAGNYSNAYDAVKRLHPNWLVKRSTSSANRAVAIITYVDGVSYGDISWLRNVQGASIESIQRIDAGTATTRWGTGHSEGVIYVTTTKRAGGSSSGS